MRYMKYLFALVLLVLLAACGSEDTTDYTPYENQSYQDQEAAEQPEQPDQPQSPETEPPNQAQETPEAPEEEPETPEPEEAPPTTPLQTYITLPENQYFFTQQDLPPTLGTGYTWLIPPILNPTSFSNDRAIMWNLEDNDLGWFIGDITGRIIATENIGTIAHYHNGMAFINNNTHWSIVDLATQNVTPLGHFDTFWPMPEYGVASVSIGTWPEERSGFIDFTGREIVPIEFWRNMSQISEGLAPVSIDDPDWHYISERFGFVDIRTGEVVITPEYGWVQDFAEGLAAVVVGPLYWGYDYRWGFINPRGEMVIPAIYEGVMSFSEGMAAVMIGRDESYQFWGFIDRAGTEVIPPIYYEVMPFSEGLAAVRMGNWPDIRWGFIDPTGLEVIPLIYEDVMPFSDGLAAVLVDGKWGFIDQTGQEVIPPTNALVRPFENGRAWTYVGYAVWINPCDGGPTPYGGQWQLINTSGTVLATLPYAYVIVVGDNMAMVRVGSDELYFCDIAETHFPLDAGRWGGIWGLVRLDM